MALKVAVFATHYPYPETTREYVSNGGARVAREVATGLAERRHDVTVFSSGSEEKSESIQSGVKVVRHNPIFRVGGTNLSPRLMAPVTEDFDILHAHNTTPPGMIAGYITAKWSGTPLVVTHHGNDRYVPMGSLPKRCLDYVYSEVVLDRILSRASAITLPSGTYLEESERMARYRDKTRVIPNGVHREEFQNTNSRGEIEERFEIHEDTVVVLFVGELSEKKDPSTLISAFQQVVTETDDIRLIVAGDGPRLDELRGVAPPDIILPGYVDERTKRGLFGRADVFCLPSQFPTEVFPLTILEAYASGTPVVVSDLRTFEEFVIEDETGLVFERANPQDLADKLSEIVSDADLRRFLGQNAAVLSGGYQWSEILTQYESLFTELTGPNRLEDG